MLLSQRIVHGMFNDALSRLNIQHIEPLPLSGAGFALTQTFWFPLGSEKRQEQQQQEEQPVQNRVPANQEAPPPPPPPPPPPKPASRPRSKRNRTTEYGELPEMPEELVSVLSEHLERVKAQSPEEQEKVLEQAKIQPNKKYSCTQYNPAYVDWLDRVCLYLYNLLEKWPIVTTATGKEREEFARVTSEAGYTLPLDMRCTGCRRRFKIPTWRAADSTVQKSMTHMPGSTRASHCLRCRVLDWDLADRPDELHPARLVIVPVSASNTESNSAKEKTKKRRRIVVGFIGDIPDFKKNTASSSE